MAEEVEAALTDRRHLLVEAGTGTGKTLAFLLPIFHTHRSGLSDPQGLVVCPTRELAIQVAGEAKRFGAHLGIRTVLAYGGTSSGDQKRLLREGADLVVGTPGRLLDFVNSAWLSLRRVRNVVLDEADRMLDMGFINEVDAILSRNLIEGTRKVLATLTPREERVLRLRFGIGIGHDHTLEEVGQDFEVTRERIRQIEAKALRKLRHPSRSKRLKAFVES